MQLVVKTWSGYQPIISNNCSLCSMLRPVWCCGFITMTTSPTLSQSFIGCVYHNGSTTRSWRLEHCMAWFHRTWISWFVLLICLVVAVYAHHHHTSCMFLHIVFQPPVAFLSVAASILWNSLPPDIQSSASLSVFCQRLKTHPFHQSFTDVLLQ